MRLSNFFSVIIKSGKKLKAVLTESTLCVLANIFHSNMEKLKVKGSTVAVSKCTLQKLYPKHVPIKKNVINAKKIITVKCGTYAVAQKKPEKNQACRKLNPDLRDTSAASKPTGSWSLNWFIIYQGKMKIFIISSLTFWVYYNHLIITTFLCLCILFSRCGCWLL